MSDILYTTGIDPTGTFLVGGAYTFKDEVGFPVDILVDELRDKKNFAVDWCEYLADAGRQKSWKFDAAVFEMSHILGEPLAQEILRKFKAYFNVLLEKFNSDDPDLWIKVCSYIVEEKRKLSMKF